MKYLSLLTLIAASGPLIILRPMPPRTKVYAPYQRNQGGWYLHRKTNTWRHDGGAYPDTNYPEQNKEREFLQLEDPENILGRTGGKR